jgi:hypothetical protein
MLLAVNVFFFFVTLAVNVEHLNSTFARQMAVGKANPMNKSKTTMDRKESKRPFLLQDQNVNSLKSHLWKRRSKAMCTKL